MLVSMHLNLQFDLFQSKFPSSPSVLSNNLSVGKMDFLEGTHSAWLKSFHIVAGVKIK